MMESLQTLIDLYWRMSDLRHSLDDHFAEDTAYPGTNYVRPSSGHCAAVSYIVYVLHGGEFVSARYNGASHWFNRIDGFDVDITGDQYGHVLGQLALPVRIGWPGHLYPDTRARDISEMKPETMKRARLLMQRAGL